MKKKLSTKVIVVSLIGTQTLVGTGLAFAEITDNEQQTSETVKSMLGEIIENEKDDSVEQRNEIGLASEEVDLKNQEVSLKSNKGSNEAVEMDEETTETTDSSMKPGATTNESVSGSNEAINSGNKGNHSTNDGSQKMNNSSTNPKSGVLPQTNEKVTISALIIGVLLMGDWTSSDFKEKDNQIEM